MQGVFTADEVAAMLRKPEGQFIEFKSLWNRDEDQPRLLKRPKVRDWIAEMVEKGVVRPPTSAGRGAVYRLSGDLAERRAWLEPRVRLLHKHFETHEALTNSQYRTRLGVTRNSAKKDLRALTEKGFLRLVGQRRGARYLPGPQLALRREK